MTLPSVNRVVVDTTFVEDAYNDIPWDQRLPDLMKMLVVISDKFNKVQIEAVKIAYARFLDNATGDMLGGVASRFFIKREGRDDNTLRAAIKLHAVRQDSEGTREDIVRILQILAGEGGLVGINKLPKGGIQTIISIDCLNLSELTVDIESIFPVNTNLQFLSYKTININHKPFGFRSIHYLNDPSKEDKVGAFQSLHKVKSEGGNRFGVIAIDTGYRIRNNQEG
ncbi:hypothetical protein NVP1084O_178 [Vibrio phage 1.084.O._10N.261.49.F5]|nr:hypothetical protein NVP1084O_178 [Vibrio phage 1.084.O._10N.261.49.F5]